MVVKWMVIKCIISLMVLSSSNAESERKEDLIVTTKTSKREYYEGENALLTCIVSSIGEQQTVIWSKVFDGRKKILAIDNLRAVQDKRIEVLHDPAPTFNTSLIRPTGDVWVLSVKNVTLKDSGGYICKVNSVPAVQKYFVINVKPAVEAEVEAVPSGSHNYTKCCDEAGVDDKCLGFCKINNIMDGSTGIAPEKCEAQFPKIVQCMADLRDHTPCCENQGIPQLCQDLCRGEYTIQGDLIQSQFSCSAYTEATLLCISEGIEILPRAPQDPSAIASGPTSIQVQWGIPLNSPKIDNFLINATKILKFDPPYDIAKQADDVNKMPFLMPNKMQVKVPGNASRFHLENLLPLTWYEISVKSLNKHGSSVAPYRIRVLTKAMADKSPRVNPKLPDVMGCCRSKGIKHERCLQKLCNPHQRYLEEPDLIVCAAWAKESFSCLAGDFDHTDCCKSKGLPDKCVELCSGNVTQIDYTYFKCVDYFNDYRSCLLKGYGVLPSPPTNVKVTNIQSTFALFSWDLPKENNKSVISYHAYFRPIALGGTCEQPKTIGSTDYLGVHSTTSPAVLEDLCPDATYEIYIQAFNRHGTSDPSSRLIFSTPKEQVAKRMFAPYNLTECCKQVLVSPACRPLCDHNPRMSQVRNLFGRCRAEMPSVLKCVVGGRDHRPCCERKGVPEACLSVCAGSFHGMENMATKCLPYRGNIMMCLEEGIGILPGPINGLHATQIINGKITLVWNPPSDGANITSYQVQYQKTDEFTSTHNNYAFENNVNVSLPVVEIKNLEENSLYSFLVLSMNEWGSSLPSSILTVNMTVPDSPKTVVGVVSSPHSLLLEGKSATTLNVVWQPPAISLPTDRFSYTIHYAPLSSTNETLNYKEATTGANGHQITDLVPNTQYVIYATASSDLGDSKPSETLLVWTDPAYPAFVEAPTIHPEVVIEGGTMTILCIAMGSPPPKVSLYIAGKLVHEDITRHMITIVKNVSRQMGDIACYADNGYGTPMQSVVSIPISHRPTIYANEMIRGLQGGKVVLECRVTAWPEPSMVWWLDPEKREPVIHGGNITVDTLELKQGAYVMRMTLENAKDGEYYCAASNPMGDFTHTIKVRTIAEVKLNLNVSNCCLTSNISQACIHACDFGQVDFHQIMNRDECIPDFEKFLKCGADGSDHRGCCSKAGMPGPCLDYCRGRITMAYRLNNVCLLQWAPTVFDCFHEGQDKLPGPPVNLQIISLSSTSAKISWDPPLKNPDSVELYRVFWRSNGTSYPYKADTVERNTEINNLIEGYTYETAVKAGNIHGTSILSGVKTFTHSRSYVSSQHTSETDKVGLAFGIIFSIAFVVLAALGVWWFIRRKPMLLKGPKGVSFENPSYIREQGGDAVQIAETPTDGTNNTILSNGSSNSISMRETNSSEVWNTQAGSETSPSFDNDINPKGGYSRFGS